jgi:hypothetical protein
LRKTNINAAAASNGRTALQVALEGGYLTVIPSLLKIGAKAKP